MKKLLTVLLTLLMVFNLVGCNSKEDTPVVDEPIKQEEVVEQTNEEPEVVGGYIDVEDGTLTGELKDIFTKALEGLTGATYEPQELVATQVVSGTNYKFLANGTKTTNPVTKGTYYVTVYKDLQGNVSLLDIETIEEKQEEKKTVDPTQYSYWVVVYDQFDNEISRDAIKYGTTVKDPDGNDVVVNGNKYFHTTIDYSSKGSGNSSTISTIADVLATVEGFPKDLIEDSSPTVPSDAWTNGTGVKAFTYKNLSLILKGDKYMYAALTTGVEFDATNKCYTATVSTLGTLTFNMDDGKLDNIQFTHNEGKKEDYDGTYAPQIFDIMYWLCNSSDFSSAPNGSCGGEEVTIVPNKYIWHLSVVNQNKFSKITGTLNGAEITFNYVTVNNGDVIKFIMPNSTVIIEVD